MGAQDQSSIVYGSSFQITGQVLTAGTESVPRFVQPGTVTTAVLQNNFLSALYTPNEVWRPVGIAFVLTTGTTVTAAVITLRKNGVNAATGGTITIPIQALNLATEAFSPFSAYTFAAADAIGDVWSIIPTTTSTTGVMNFRMIYAIKRVLGVTDGVLI